MHYDEYVPQIFELITVLLNKYYTAVQKYMLDFKKSMSSTKPASATTTATMVTVVVDEAGLVLSV